MSSPTLLRLFFALPCPSEQAEAIAAWRASLPAQGKPTQRENLHLTLAFLGMQSTDLLPHLEQIGANIQLPRFALTLDSLQCWSSGILHLAPSAPIAPLMALQQQLREQLSAIDIQLEHQTYRPHLTLARQCAALPHVAAPDFHWQVEHFALYLSESTAEGVLYRPLASWPLG